MWFFASICNIFVGYVSNKYANDWPIIILGSILMMIAHSFYIFMPDCDRCWESVVPLMILGLAYSIYSILLYCNLPTLVDQ